MPEDPERLVKKLETSARAWNAVVDGAFPDIDQFLARVREGIERLQAFVGGRPRIRVEALLTRAQMDLAGSSPGDRGNVAGSLGGLVEHLESWLDDFNIELQTLQAQAKRTLDAGNRLADALRPFQEKPVPAIPSVPSANTVAAQQETTALRAEISDLRKQLAAAEARAQVKPALAPPERSAREAALEGEVQQLCAKVASLRRELADAVSRPPVVPLNVQEELATLRVEVATLRETNERLSRPLPGTSRERFDVIASQAFDPEGNRKQLGQILLDAGVIKTDQLMIALHEQNSSWRRHLGSILVDLGFATEENIAQALAAQLALPYNDLRLDPPSDAALGLVSRQLAIHHTCIPVRVTSDALTVAMANPLDLVSMDDLRLAAGRTVMPVVATASQIRQAIREYYLV